VSGTVSLAAIATDDIALASGRFLVDGVAVGAAALETPYELRWTTTSAANGTRTISTMARDTAGDAARNQTTSQNVVGTVAH
jgi:hypothetical protein